MKQIVVTIFLVVLATSIFIWKEFDRMNQKDTQLSRMLELEEIERQKQAQLDQLKKKTLEQKNLHRVQVVHDNIPETNTYPIILDASGSRDPDEGDKISYEWIQISGNPVRLKPHPTAPIVSFNGVAGDYVFELTITDNYGAQTTQLKSVKISPEPNKHPVVDIKVRKGKGTELIHD